jgi:hypothetical protein
VQDHHEAAAFPWYYRSILHFGPSKATATGDINYDKKRRDHHPAV